MARLKKKTTLITLLALGLILYSFIGTDYECGIPLGSKYRNGFTERFTTQDQQEGSLFKEQPPRTVEELSSYTVPNVVYYIWCENKTFEFKHFLSLKSIWKNLEPEMIEFYYYYYPPLQDDYNDWLDILNTTIPNMVMGKLAQKCDTCRNFVIDHLFERGGIYVADDTILLSPLGNQRKNGLSAFIGSNNSLKIMMSSPKNGDIRSLGCLNNFKFRESTVVKTNFCKGIRDFNSDVLLPDTECMDLTGSVVPRDIFTPMSNVTVRLREIAYGVTEPLVPHSDGQSIPKIVHYIWYNRSNMTFMMYLSIMSSLHIVKPDRIYVHGGHSLEGHYWDKVKVHPKIQIINRLTSRYIYGHHVLFTHHISDVTRADILYKYGGIYLDWDVLWLNPVDDLLSSGYDVIVSVDHMSRIPYPDTINMGVVLAKPRSRYILLWRQTYQHYQQMKFFYNPIQAPYKVYERYPTTLRIEPRLQVMCYFLKCHPAFHPDFKNHDSAQPFNWRSDVYSIHFTHPDPKEYESEEALSQGRGMFADIGRHILQAAYASKQL